MALFTHLVPAATEPKLIRPPLSQTKKVFPLGPQKSCPSGWQLPALSARILFCWTSQKVPGATEPKKTARTPLFPGAQMEKVVLVLQMRAPGLLALQEPWGRVVSSGAEVLTTVENVVGVVGVTTSELVVKEALVVGSSVLVVGVVLVVGSVLVVELVVGSELVVELVVGSELVVELVVGSELVVELVVGSELVVELVVGSELVVDSEVDDVVGSCEVVDVELSVELISDEIELSSELRGSLVELADEEDSVELDSMLVMEETTLDAEDTSELVSEDKISLVVTEGKIELLVIEGKIELLVIVGKTSLVVRISLDKEDASELADEAEDSLDTELADETEDSLDSDDTTELADEASLDRDDATLEDETEASLEREADTDVNETEASLDREAATELDSEADTDVNETEASLDREAATELVSETKDSLAIEDSLDREDATEDSLEREDEAEDKGSTLVVTEESCANTEFTQRVHRSNPCDKVAVVENILAGEMVDDKGESGGKQKSMKKSERVRVALLILRKSGTDRLYIQDGELFY